MIFVSEQKLKEIVAAAVRAALTVELTIKRRRDPQTGLLLAVPQEKTETVFLPSVITQMIPFHEGALRGLQEDLGKHAVAAAEIRRLADSIEAARPLLTRIAEVIGRPPALPENTEDK